MLGTVTKAGKVLDLFTPEHPEWGVSEAAVTLGMPKSGVHSLLSTLVEIGLVQRTQQGRYRLGWRILALSRTLIESAAFQEEAQRRMQRTADRFGKTMHLAALDGGEIVYIAKAESRMSESIGVSGVGKKLAAHCSSVGKVLLAARGPDYVAAAAVDGGLPRRTPATITSLEKLQRHLVHVRERGYAYDLQEGMANLCCVGAPIRDRTGTVQAAMSISVPTHWFRQNPDLYRQLAQTTAADVSRTLGYMGGESLQAAASDLS